MSRIDPSPQQPQSEAGDLALHAGVVGREPPAFDQAASIANSIIALANTFRGDPRVSFWQLPTRVVVGIDTLHCAICTRCHEVIGLADSATDAALLFCRVCDEVDTARVRGRHILSRLLALRHGLSLHQASSVNATQEI